MKWEKCDIFCPFVSIDINKSLKKETQLRAIVWKMWILPLWDEAMLSLDILGIKTPACLKIRFVGKSRQNTSGQFHKEQKKGQKMTGVVAEVVKWGTVYVKG